VNARGFTTLLRQLLSNHYMVQDVYQYPNEDLLTRQEGLLVQLMDGSEFRITVVQTKGANEGR
jgi:hypothetical protein